MFDAQAIDNDAWPWSTEETVAREKDAAATAAAVADAIPPSASFPRGDGGPLTYAVARCAALSSRAGRYSCPSLAPFEAKPGA